MEEFCTGWGLPAMKLDDSPNSTPEHPTFFRAVLVWLKVGLLSFGGPTGQIALMHRELVEKRRWLSDGRFLHALNYCMILPGPEAQQLAIYTGWLLHRTWGGVIAGVLFVLPGALLMWAISVVYVMFGTVPIVEAVFYGLKPAVMAIVAAAVIRIGQKVLRRRVMWVLAVISFVCIFFINVPFPLIVIGAGMIGYWGGEWRSDLFELPTRPEHGCGGRIEPSVVGDQISDSIPKPSVMRTVGSIFLWGGLWLLPVVLSIVVLGWQNILSQQGLFFSKAALVTFGGAYAVLPYVAQQAVESHGWLSTAQMMDGLGLAETTPGPLILVLQFVGFMGGWANGGGASPLVTATLAAAMTCWVTFLPGFLFIFAGAPYIERTRGNLRLNNVLSAVTAAVVGVVLNLAVWFAWQVISPAPGQWDFVSLVFAGLFFLVLQRWKWDVLWVVGAGAVLGLAGWAYRLI